ncbi:unnamed protein product [Adineta steineri]|uniref:Envelope fusion glycoprotein n=1 Tax=Adineta steineri TaxID=433720 RepID=A0A814AP17_9BILA|nr:unnamed protein product [Adineta steineri]CAF1364727.1 unnamed protein product [Adineta steineri]
MLLAYLTVCMLLSGELTILVSSLSTTLIINIDKGVAFDQIGYYSEQLEEVVLHIFIPINNYCLDSPNSNVCQHIEKSNSDLVEIGTIISVENILFSRYDKGNVSTIINLDIERILSHHQVEKFIDNTKSMIYYFDNNFYVTKNMNKDTFHDGTIDIHHQKLLQYTANPINLVLKQLFQDKIGYDFLTKDQILEILSLPMLSLQEQFDLNHSHESLTQFKKMIIGQTVYALKSCSLSRIDRLSKDSSCLAVSTLFRKIPVKTSSVYNVYRTIPLPITIDGQKYVYSSLPNILGVNTIDKTIVQWNENNFVSDCIVSDIIQCRKIPISIPLSSVACVSDILDTTADSDARCEVTRSTYTQPSIMNIKNDIWLFYSNDESYECVVHSALTGSANTISVSEPSILKLPCEHTIHCSHIVLPSIQCLKTTVTLKTMNNNNSNIHFTTPISIKRIMKHLLSISEIAAETSFRKLKSKMKVDRFSFKENIEEFLSLIISIILSMVFGILILILKYSKAKIQKQLNKLQTNLNILHTEYIDQI